MNKTLVFRYLCKTTLVGSLMFLLPAIVSLLYGEFDTVLTFVIVGAGLAVLSLPMIAVKPKKSEMYNKEGLVIVAMLWIVFSIAGAMPFYISGEIPRFVDALFESISGFTTTGSTILTDVESLSHGMLFWRSFTHWIGGMGILVFALAVLPSSKDSMYLMRAECPGPQVGKLVPKGKNTAVYMYSIYGVLTVITVILLCAGGMPLFDSVVHAFGTAGTGGFGIKADSIASYNPACQWIITVFMVLFGVNFNLYYLLLLRKFRSAFSSRELWIYGGVIVVSVVIVTINITGNLPFTQTAGEGIRYAAFQVVSFMTTTGYLTVPASSSINDFPLLSKGLLFLLMFIGGCAGSTAGGLKVSRVALLFCSFKKELRRIIHPRNANAVRFEKKVISDDTLRSVNCYFGIYILIIAVVFFILCFDPVVNLTLEENLTAAVSCLNNIGPAYGLAANGYYMYSWLSKLVLTFAMVLGRLEIFPLILTFSPSTWLKK